MAAADTLSDDKYTNTLTQFNEPKKELRNSLVETAVKFLISPKVLSYDEQSKIKFLEKKGMNKEEILMAMAKALMLQNKNYPEYHQMAIPPPIYPPAVPIRNSYLSTLQYIANFSIFLSGIAVGLHYIYKHYIGPFLTGRKPKSNEDTVIEIQQSVMDVLQQIHTTLERMDTNISEHSKILNELKVSEQLVKDQQYPELNEIKTEISTIKGLLINRKSFPATPQVIPSWQMLMKEDNEKEEDDAIKKLTNGSSDNNTNKDSDEDEQEILINDE